MLLLMPASNLLGFVPCYMELGVRLPLPVLMHCDNLSTTYMAANPLFHARTRHIELDYHFVREKVALGSYQVCFIPSVDQPADLLTKPLHKPRHHLLCSKLVRPRQLSLRARARGGGGGVVKPHAFIKEEESETDSS